MFATCLCEEFRRQPCHLYSRLYRIWLLIYYLGVDEVSRSKVRNAGFPLSRTEWLFIAGSLVLSVLAGILTLFRANSILIFVISGGALALFAALVGQATDQLSTRLGPGATGVLQSALGNLPELFVGIFALRAGLITVVQSALVGSILGNSLLVLCLAFLVGGLRNGPQRFASDTLPMIADLTLLSVAAFILPTISSKLHIPAAGHEDVLSIASAVILLVVFIASSPVSLQGGRTMLQKGEAAAPPSWPFGFELVS